MTTSYPTGLDSFINPSGSDKLDGPAGTTHADQHTNINDAVDAIQSRIGVTGSTDPTSLDYEVHNVDHGHDHDGVNSRPVKLGTSGSSCEFSDGLFIDWTNFTAVGQAVCQINGILKKLAPSPAPDLYSLGADSLGVNGNLSFGASQGITGYTNAAGTGSLPSEDINDSYLVSTYTGDLRRGIFNATTTITGALNDAVVGDPPAYPANAFGSADTGELIMELNGVQIISASLESTTGFIFVSSANGSFLDISASSPAACPNGNVLNVFKHRRASYSVAPADQREGWNFIKISHRSIVGDPVSPTTVTNYVEWVVDSDTTGLTAPSGSLHTATLTGSRYLTGVKYYTSGTVLYDTAISSAYLDTYSTGSAVSFNGTSIDFSSQSLSGITIGSENETKTENITNVVGTINTDKLTPGALTASVNCNHPLGPDLSSAATSYLTGVFLYNKPENSTILRERFQDENYRLLPSSGTNDFDLQTDIGASGWDSTTNWSGSAEQLPLVVFCDSLRALPKLPDSTYNLSGGKGDFTGFVHGPSGNVDYSDFTGNLYYYRKFQNNTGGCRSNFTLYMTGSGTVVTSSAGLGANDGFLLEFKLPEKTGWNVFSPFELLGKPQIPSDGAGILDGAFNNTLTSSIKGTFGTLDVSASAHIVMRVTAGSQWTGCLEDFTLVWT